MQARSTWSNALQPPPLPTVRAGEAEGHASNDKSLFPRRPSRRLETKNKNERMTALDAEWMLRARATRLEGLTGLLDGSVLAYESLYTFFASEIFPAAPGTLCLGL